MLTGTRVFVDDLSATFQQGGKAYSNYGIDPLEGAIVVVRPDGYVGVVAPFENISAVDAYFSAFFKSYMPRYCTVFHITLLRC